MTGDDLPRAVEMSVAVGWPHTTNDWAVAFELGHGVVAVEDRDVVGVMLWWPQGPNDATLGLAIVPGEHQRRGIGRLLIDETLRQAGNRTVSLCGTEAGLRLYERSGFVAHGSILQLQGVATVGEARASDQDLLKPTLAAMLAIDAQVDGRSRGSLLRALLADGEVLGLRRDGALVGWSICRPFGRGWVIGPVVAQSGEDAERLIVPWLDRQAGEFVRVDTPAGSGLASPLAARGLAQVGEVVTMTRGDLPVPGELKRYALASQAFG